VRASAWFETLTLDLAGAADGIRFSAATGAPAADTPRQEQEMPVIQHNPPGVFPPYRCYSRATEIRGEARLLIISGLNGYHLDGETMPESFEDQGDLIWTHLRTILQAANMDYQNLVSVRTYLAAPHFDEANARLRVKYLGSHRPSLTVVCCRLLDSRWKLEIEAMAAT
jgi:2-iminobutanoate/2-iminopropanoate deaminase